MKNNFAVFLLCFLIWLFMVAAKPLPAINITTTDSPWLTEADFAADVSLHATRDQTVVLHLEHSKPGKRAIHENVIRFLVEEVQKYSFCIPDDEPYIRRVKLKLSNGRTVLNGHRGGDCKVVVLKPGRYRLDIFHDGRALPLEGKKAFLHRPERRRHRRSQNLIGETHGGTLQELLVYPNFFALSGGSNSIGKMYPQAFLPDDPLILSANSSGLIDSNVWSFYDAATDFPQFTNSRPMLPWVPETHWRMTNIEVTFTPFISGVFQAPPNAMKLQVRNCPHPTLDTKIIYYCLPGFILNDQGNGIYTMWADVDLNIVFPWVEGQSGSPKNKVPILISDTSGQVTSSNHITWDFTYIGYADASTMPKLQEGEFAIYSECDFKGTAFFFDADVDFDQFTSLTQEEITPPFDNILSIQLGPSTFLQMFKDEADITDVGANIDCASEALQVDQITVFVDVLKFIAATSSCINCNLAEFDFSNDDFTGVDFSGAILTSANLTDTNFTTSNLTDANLDTITGSSLSGTNFTGATLGCTSFKGSVLTDAIFVDNVLVTDQSCYLDLSATTLNFDTFDPTNWRYLDLSSSNMNNVPQTLSSEANPLDLSGAILNNVKWLNGKTLDNINLGCYPLEENQMTVCPTPIGSSVCSTLQGIVFSNSSLKNACLANASMEGVFLGSSNLDGANLSGAQLQALTGGKVGTLDGAFMRNVTLTGANLTGVSAQNVNFYTASGGEAIADKLTAPGANFSGAYLAGANFSSLNNNLQSTNWSNAMLINANFSQADLTTNTSGGVNSGTNTTFKGAYLQGAQFSGAQLDNASFLDTYWDAANSDGKVNILIPSDNLEFTGYWKDTSLPECPPTLKNISNVLPAGTTIQNTCPNNQPGPCEESDWNNPEQNISNAFFKSARPDAFPQDLSVSADKQCGTSTNPADICWLISNDPGQCPEN